MEGFDTHGTIHRCMETIIEVYDMCICANACWRRRSKEPKKYFLGLGFLDSSRSIIDLYVSNGMNVLIYNNIIIIK